jgi:hypothetical protein
MIPIFQRSSVITANDFILFLFLILFVRILGEEHYHKLKEDLDVIDSLMPVPDPSKIQVKEKFSSETIVFHKIFVFSSVERIANSAFLWLCYEQFWY